jgi:hypothetical protein
MPDVRKELELIYTLMLIEGVDIEDDIVFSFIINMFTKLSKLGDEYFVEKLNVDIPTVSRWRSGKNAPCPLMKKPVYELIKKELQCLIG